MLLYFSEHKIKFVKIPKNACSTVINSLGWSVVRDRNPHEYDHEFFTTLQDTSSWHCLVVLRDPYERLISGYLNKLIYPSDEEPFSHDLLDTVWLEDRGTFRFNKRSSISFKEFVNFVCRNDDESLDQHWQSQAHHINEAQPSLVLDLVNLQENWESSHVLNKIKLRNYAPHSTSSILEINKDLSLFDGSDIDAFRRVSDHFPPKSAFANTELERLVRKRYAMDYDLRQKFGLV